MYLDWVAPKNETTVRGVLQLMKAYDKMRVPPFVVIGNQHLQALDEYHLYLLLPRDICAKPQSNTIFLRFHSPRLTYIQCL